MMILALPAGCLEEGVYLVLVLAIFIIFLYWIHKIVTEMDFVSATLV
jgi:hypothetical protein